MRYFVILPDGRKFGPADEPLLLQWMHEGRINRDMDLQEEGSDVRIKVGELPTLREAPANPTESPFMRPPEASGNSAQHASYYRPGYVQGDIGASELSSSWVLSGIGLGITVVSCLCCPLLNLLVVILPIFGLVMANKALAKGNPSASGAKIFAIVVIVIAGLIGVGGLLLNLLFFAGGPFFRPYTRF